MKEMTLCFGSEIALEKVLDQLCPYFTIIIREKGIITLVDKARSDYQGNASDCSRVKPEGLLKRGTSGRAKLSEREHQIVKGLSNGKTYQEIAEEMGVNINNLRYYIKKIYRKLGVNSAREAVRICQKQTTFLD